jgi:flagellin
VGRLTFQIGASAGQVVTIDLADYGSQGPITGELTGDIGALVPTIEVGTVQGANSVLSVLDRAMDKVNADRAKMGAVMNRLAHVIENLSTISTNSSASRSQIEDADYAKASSDMARAQIIQQAATAVLAQANASEQTVLKLLQG